MAAPLTFRRSSYCNQCECVEVASDPHGRRGVVRDSKQPATVVGFGGDAWLDFLDHIRRIEHGGFRL